MCTPCVSDYLLVIVFTNTCGLWFNTYSEVEFQPTAAGVAVVGDGQLNNVVGGGAGAQEEQAQAESTASEEETRNAPTGDSENVQV